MVMTNADSGPGSLRDAITTANMQAGNPTIINFDIMFDIFHGGPQTLALLTPLPLVDARVVLDGATQPGYSGTPLITLTQSSSATGVTDGLNLFFGASTVQGLMITGFTNGDGIAVTGDGDVVNSNVITGNKTGLVVGGVRNEIAGNLVSGNQLDGVDVPGSKARVEGNLIGTNAAGTAAQGNGGNGVSVVGMNDIIGGTPTNFRNIISGNGDNGVNVNAGPMSDNLIEGNYIGTNAAGSAAVPNGISGIEALGSGVTIGGSAAGAGNVISGNTYYGIAGFALIQGNKIGTDATGNVSLPNGLDGIYMSGGFQAPLGSGQKILGNLISGNGRFGVFLYSNGGNVVQGNTIGLGQGGAKLPNGAEGVAIFAGASNNVIGGTGAGDGNTISGNNGYGIWLDGSTTMGNWIQGNRIGTSADGTMAEGNGLDGIDVLDGATLNVIGGTVAGAGNVISANGRDGIFMDGAGTTNAIEGNFIGTSAAGSAALGNHGNGIALAFTPNTFIGGTTAGAGNIISGNFEGVVLVGLGTTGNVVQDDFIGTDKSGSAAIGNTEFGVDIAAGAAGNVVGGTASGAANTIAFNGRTGVVIGTSVSDTGTTGDSILGNSIFGNVFQGIDLGNDGPTPNTPGGPHSGPNHLQNFPVIQSVTASGSGTAITVSLNSTPGHGFRIEVFADSDGQGKTFLGAGGISTDGNGNGSTTITVATAFSSLVGQKITATATDMTTGDTSEFSFPAFAVS